MALSTVQKIALYQILEVPWQASVTHLQDADHLVGIQLNISELSTRQAKAQLEAYITAYVDADADVLSEVQTLCDRWRTLGTMTVSMEQGGSGAATGIRMDPNDERRMIQTQMRAIVPFYQRHLVLEREFARNPNVEIMR